MLRGSLVALRELGAIGDAEALFAAMSTEDVAQFISPPPTSVDGFERFIAWTLRQRASGRYVCVGRRRRRQRSSDRPLPDRSHEPDFGCSEWGFALAVENWGTGVFVDAARLAVDFVFDMLGAYRLEARAVLKNGRGDAALRTVGATHEAVLRRSFLRNGEFHDQALWTIFADEWLHAKASNGSRLLH